ncbi:hypothetical protein KTE19_10140 [Lentilactobacillus sp. IMAU92037]|uniref:hypothetical protein n=1 Tax=Lentilactobacillus TaxID=2767893 RepID=UPI001C2792CA|nr:MULTISPECIES: hypothetical protein [Lentilactobacillus]MBU9790205.1 hypothetical protein [Lentilactobacillus dabitei]MBV0931048.1 hypothetical protein [Lentilactobacillus dabitei]MDM7516907.1 hypothetical protein [Lentilactobacillus sp. TOM.63]
MKRSTITILLTLIFCTIVVVSGVNSNERDNAAAANPNAVSKAFRGNWYGNETEFTFYKDGVRTASPTTNYTRSGNYFVFGPTNTQGWKAFGTPNTQDVTIARITEKNVAGFTQPVLEEYKVKSPDFTPHKVYYYTRNNTDVMKSMTGTIAKVPQAHVEGFNME